MGIEKAEIKKAVAYDIGCSLEDALEAAKNEVHRWEGSKLAYRQAADGVNALVVHLKKDVEAGELGLEEAEGIKRWLMRGTEICRNLGLQSDALICKAKGKIEALEKSILMVKKVHDREEQKISDSRAIADEEKDINPRRNARPVGQHPGRSEAQNRRVGVVETSEQKLPTNGV